MLRISRIFARRALTTTSTFFAPIDGAQPQVSEKIVKLVDDIGSLTILEVSQLNTLMKSKFGLSDVAVAAAPAAGAPVAAVAAIAEVEEEEEAAPAVVQTEFTVKLKSFETKAKIKVIKQIKSSIAGINLVEAKKLVESAPCDIKKDIPKDEADELKAVFEKLGAVMEIL